MGVPGSNLGLNNLTVRSRPARLAPKVAKVDISWFEPDSEVVVSSNGNAVERVQSRSRREKKPRGRVAVGVVEGMT
jgi:hypothetical protein